MIEKNEAQMEETEAGFTGRETEGRRALPLQEDFEVFSERR